MDFLLIYSQNKYYAILRSRSLVNSYADLVKPETWTDE
jgi:hypothetical protein